MKLFKQIYFLISILNGLLLIKSKTFYNNKCHINEIIYINFNEYLKNIYCENDYCQKCFNKNRIKDPLCKKCPAKELLQDLKILSPWDTLNEIIYNNKSLSRFGDGEFRLIYGDGIRFQKPSKKLSLRLIEVLESQLKNLLIGINNSIKPDYLNKFNKLGKNFWSQWIEDNKIVMMILLNKNIYYGSSLISRFYIDYEDKSEVPEFVKLLKKIWDKKDILIVEGEKTRLGVMNDLLDNVKSIQRILCPANNAFEVYDKIYSEILKYAENKLILIALGPTATILTYDLYKEGYQAIDIGHVDIEYEWYLRNAKERIQIKYKYVNEVNKGKNTVDDIDDENYKNEIISKIINE